MWLTFYLLEEKYFYNLFRSNASIIDKMKNLLFSQSKMIKTRRQT